MAGIPFHIRVNIKIMQWLDFCSSCSNEALDVAIITAFNSLAEKYNGTDYRIEAMKKIFPSVIRCDQALSVIGQITAQYYYDVVEGQQNTSAVMFVTGCADVMAYAIDFARGEETVLDDKTRGPTLVRFGAYQASEISLCFLALLNKFSWRHVTSLVDTSTEYYVEVGGILRYDLRTHGDYVGQMLRFDFATKTDDDIASYMMVVQQSSRVVLLVVPMPQARRILAIASDLGMTNGEYVYIVTWPFDNPQFGNLSWKYLDQYDEGSRIAFHSVLVITTAMQKKGTVEKIRRSLRRNNFSLERVDSVLMNPHIVDTYTAITETAKMIASLPKANFSTICRDGAFLADQFRNRTFITDYGNLVMDEMGDKVSEYSVLSFNAETGRFATVFEFDPAQMNLSSVEHANLTWAGQADHPPLDVPKCGFQNENPNCAPDPDPWFLWVFLSLTTAMLPVIVFFLRRCRKEYDSTLAYWSIPQHDLKPFRGQFKRTPTVPHHKSPANYKFQKALSFPTNYCLY